MANDPNLVNSLPTYVHEFAELGKNRLLISSEFENSSLIKIQEEISQLQNIIQDLETKIDSEDPEISKKIEEITNSLNKLTSESNNLKAEVVLPPSEEMTLQLVTAQSLDRLDEYRSNITFHLSVAFTFLGTIIGYLLTLKSVEDWLKITILMILILIYSLIQARIFHVRAKEIKKRMVNREINE
jgi:flagellar biosynthesis chaperone FliJ